MNKLLLAGLPVGLLSIASAGVWWSSTSKASAQRPRALVSVDEPARPLTAEQAEQWRSFSPLADREKLASKVRGTLSNRQSREVAGAGALAESAATMLDLWSRGSLEDYLAHARRQGLTPPSWTQNPASWAMIRSQMRDARVDWSRAALVDPRSAARPETRGTRLMSTRPKIEGDGLTDDDPLMRLSLPMILSAEDGERLEIGVEMTFARRGRDGQWIMVAVALNNIPPDKFGGIGGIYP